MQIIVLTENHQKEMLILKTEMENKYYKTLIKIKKEYDAEINDN